MNKILVTGGLGFLGSHLVDELVVEPSNKVTIIDNLSSNAVDADTFCKDRPIVYLNCNVKDFFGADKPYSEIYHLASPVGPAGVLSKAGTIAENIIEDAYQIAILAKRNKSRLVFVSTSEVYGGGQDGLCSERMKPIIQTNNSARLEYAIGKLAAEIMLRNTPDLDVVIIRPFNIAGTRQKTDGGFVLPRFIKAALKNKPLTVFGDGTQVRGFTDARDVVQGLILAAKKGKRGEVYNIGNEENIIQIGELAKHIVSSTGSNSKVKFTSGKDIFGLGYVEANDKYPDSSKARTKLGWQPKYGLSEIIGSVIAQEDAK